MSESIQSLLDNKYCKIISTCRLQIFKDVKLGELPILKKLCFTYQEKSELEQKNFKEKAGEVRDLYQKNNCHDINYFLKPPYNFYKKDFDDLSASDCEKDKYKVCALVLCVIFNNRFKEEYLTTKDKEIQRIIENTLQISKLSKDASFEILDDALHTLEGSMLVKVDKVYSVIHDKLYDFMAYYFGGEMSELIIENAHCDFYQR